jgi:cytochrome c
MLPEHRPMARRIKLFSIVAFLLGISFAGWSAEFATKDEAIAMVKKAVAAIDQQGVDKTYAEINDSHGPFTDRDLYVVVYGLDGKVLAHPSAKLVGKDMIDTQDVDGKYFVKERTEMARKQAEFWQDYKFVNPTTKKIAPKQMYCQRLNETAVCAGVYRFG